MKKKLVIFGFTLLFFSSYLDNVRGPLLPILTKVLGLGYQESSVLLIAGSLGGLLFTLLLIPYLNHVKLRTAVFSVFVFGAIALGSSRFVASLPTLALFAFLLGATISVFGSMANILVVKGTKPESRASVFCLLHMMYGLGSLMGPTVTALLLQENAMWGRPLLCGIPVIILGFFTTPWILKKEQGEQEEVPQSAALTVFEVFVLVMFGLYVAGEVMISMWLSTYLMERWHFTVQGAAPYVAGFFVVMSATRAITFFGIAKNPSRERENFLLVSCLVLAVIFFVLGLQGYLWAFSLSGILGPFFPVFLARMSIVFPKKSRVILLWALGSNALGLMVCHLAMGTMADKWGVRIAYLFPGVLLTSAIALLFLYFAQEKKLV